MKQFMLYIALQCTGQFNNSKCYFQSVFSLIFMMTNKIFMRHGARGVLCTPRLLFHFYSMLHIHIMVHVLLHMLPCNEKLLHCLAIAMQCCYNDMLCYTDIICYITMICIISMLCMLCYTAML